MKRIILAIATCIAFSSCEMVNGVFSSQEPSAGKKASVSGAYKENFLFYSYASPFSDSALGVGYSSGQHSFTQGVTEDYDVKKVTNEKYAVAFSSRELSQKKDFFKNVPVLSEEDCEVFIGQESANYLNELVFDEYHSIYIKGAYAVGNKWQVTNFTLDKEASDLLTDTEKFMLTYGDSLCTWAISGFVSVSINYYTFSKDIMPEDLIDIKLQVEKYETHGITEQEREELRKGLEIPGVTKDTVVICTIADLPGDEVNSFAKYEESLKNHFPDGIINESSYSLLGYDFIKVID